MAEKRVSVSLVIPLHEPFKILRAAGYVFPDDATTQAITSEGLWMCWAYAEELTPNLKDKRNG